MPKMKSNRGAAKRFFATGGGKIARKKAGHSHILRKKNAKRRRRLRHKDYVDKTNMRQIKRLIPKI